MNLVGLSQFGAQITTHKTIETRIATVPIGMVSIAQGNFFQIQLEYDEKKQEVTKRLISKIALDQEYNNLRSVFDEGLHLRTSGKQCISIELSLYDHLLCSLEYDTDQKSQRLIASNPLTYYDLRLFNQYGSKYAHELKERATVAPLEGVHVDLHTHFGGAISSQMIVDAIKSSTAPVLYPVSLLKEMHIPFAGTVANGKIQLNDLSTSINWDRFSQAIMMSPLRTCSFMEMEDVYRLRGPIVKNVSLFPYFLEKLAEEYHKSGITYVELSLSDIVKTEWMKVAIDTLPAIEKKYQVQMRFLVAFWRHSPELYNKDILDQVFAYEKNPYIVGVDFMGHETNSTRDFIKLLDELGEYRKKRPDFVIRVHAGESPCHPENITLAIEHGATRIGHGLHGVSKEVYELARQCAVTFETNIGSNLCLNSAVSVKDIPIEACIKNRVKATLGTDGQGCYGTSHANEVKLALMLGLKTEDLEQIRTWDREYVEFMNSHFNTMIQKATPDQLLPILPPPKCPDNIWKEVEESKKRKRAEIQTLLEKQKIEVIEPTKLTNFFSERVPVLFAGASSTSWEPVEQADKERILQNIYQFFESVDPKRVVIITGGTDFGLEKIVHDVIRESAKQFQLIGTLATELQADVSTISKSLTHAVIIDTTWYDIAPKILKEISKSKGIAYFIGGGDVVKNMIQTSKNLGKIDYFLMSDVYGSSHQMAKIMPERAFSKNQGLERSLLKAAREPILTSITLTKEEAHLYFSKINKTVVMFLGFSSPYQDPQKLEQVINQTLEFYDPEKTIIAAGATGNGIGAVYPLAKKKGFQTLGVVSTVCKGIDHRSKISSDADFVIFVEDELWGGLIPGTARLSPVSEVIVTCSHEAILCGGGPIAHVEAEEMRQSNKSVIHHSMKKA